MRVDSQNISGLAGSTPFDNIGGAAGDSRGLNGTGDRISNDVVALSNASSLVAMARNISSPERAARMSSLAAQFRSGQYQPGAGEITQALVSTLQTTASGLP